MITSRGPRNREEIKVAADLFKASPFGTNPTIPWDEFVDCWEELLLRGLAHIDINELSYRNTARLLEPFLKNRQRAAQNPHYLQGFLSVIFVVFARFDFIREITTRTDDSEDPIFTFTRQFRDFWRKSSVVSPTVPLNSEGKPTEECNVYSCAVFHPWIDPRNPLILPLVGPYTKRINKSSRQFHSGFKSRAIMNAFSDAAFVRPYTSTGIMILRQYLTNSEQGSPKSQKFLTIAVKDAQDCDAFGVPHEFGILNTGHNSIHRFLFDAGDVKRQANLSKQQQKVCFMLAHGLRDEHIAQMLGPSKLGKERSLKHIRDIYEQSYYKLTEAGYEHQLTNESGSVRARLQSLVLDDAVAHEYREYLFSTYPWPEDLPSRL